jgi:hypothetical protein
MGYKYIQWSVDSIDWQGPSANTIVRRVVNGTKSGSIILFHNDLANTTEALPAVISQLKNRGFDFVTVSELIHWENYTIDHTGRQVLSAEALLHLTGEQLNAAFETLLEHLTIEEIMSLENGLTPHLIARLNTLLTEEQARAIATLGEDELLAVWGRLVEAKVTQGQIPPLPRDDNNGTTGTGTGAKPDNTPEYGVYAPPTSPTAPTPPTSPVTSPANGTTVNQPQAQPDVTTPPLLDDKPVGTTSPTAATATTVTTVTTAPIAPTSFAP